MSKSAEKRASELHEEYLADAIASRKKPHKHYLDRCPATERAALEAALYGVDYLIKNYYCPRMKKSTLDKLFDEVLQMQEQQATLEKAHERARVLSAPSQSPISNPLEYIRQVMDLPLSILVSGVQSPTASQTQFAMMNRGGAIPSTQQRRWIDETHLRSMEDTLSPRAEAILRELMMTAAPVDPAAVAKELGLFVQEVKLPLETDGCIITDGKTGGILINKTITDPRRRRYTLAHETGHFVLHKELKALQEGVDELGSFYHTVREKEANTFASYLLMPRFLMPPHILKTPPQLADADELVECFDVSLAAALRRLVRDSHWASALVVTLNGIVKWAVRSREFEAFIPTNHNPHPATMAALLLKNQDRDERAGQVPAEAWTAESSDEEAGEFREESRRLANGYVYTLLTIID